jgi:hypothetical protein
MTALTFSDIKKGNILEVWGDCPSWKKMSATGAQEWERIWFASKKTLPARRKSRLRWDLPTV